MVDREKEEGDGGRKCSRCECPIDAGDLRCSVCGQTVRLETDSREKTEVRILRCRGCGVALAYDPENQAPSCSFCDSVYELETREDPLVQSDTFLPFTVDRKDAVRAMRKWLGSLGWFRPSDLRRGARPELVKPLWWVGWVFDAEAFVTWAGDSNAGSRRSNWAPHSGRSQMVFDDVLVSASRGLNDAEAYLMTPGYDLSTGRTKPEGEDGATLEQFDVQRSQARRRIVAVVESTAAHRVANGLIPGSRSRKIHVSVVLRRLQTRRLSFPAHVMTYRYRGSLYRAVVCGQDSDRVTGTAPYSIPKIVLTVVSALVVLVIILAIVGQVLK